MRSDPLRQFIEAQLKFQEQLREAFEEIDELENPPEYECEKRKHNQPTTNPNQDLDRT